MDDKWLVIDSHIHFLPQEGIKKAAENKFNLASTQPGDKPITFKKMEDIEMMLRFMEEAGIDMAIINQAVWSSFGLDMCKEVNNGYARIKRTYPEKFICCGQIPIQPGQAVLDEVDRCISELGLDGLALLTFAPEYNLDSQELWPMYQKLNGLGIPIVFHPSMVLARWGGDDRYEIRSTVMREYEIARCLVQVVCGVLPDFPDLKILFPHLGGGMPGLKARIRAWFEPEGWPVPDNEVRHNGKAPLELDELGLSGAFDELFDKLYFDLAGVGAGWMPMLKAALATLRTDRICFGTDYPFDIRIPRDVKYFVENIKKLDITEADKKLILGENIKKLFRIAKG